MEQSVDTLAVWAANPRGEALAPDRVDELAEALKDRVRALPQMWPGNIVASLSGGRDSRVVVAALLSAGVDVRLHTNSAEVGEAVIAKQLVAALPTRVEHLVFRPAQEGERSSDKEMATLERALGWHRLSEGMRSPTYLPLRPLDGLFYPDYLAVGGAAGEVAHDLYYPPDLTVLGALPYDERLHKLLELLEKRLVHGAGVDLKAQEAARWQLQRVLSAAAKIGLDDAKILNYFFASERLRRWTGTAESNNVVSPLLAPEFVRAALDLTPEQRRGNDLHRAVTARLMPIWSDVPYYERPPGEVPSRNRPRLGLARDRGLVGALLADPERWGDGYDVDFVQREWRRLLAKEARPRGETLLQRVVWRAVFNDYLAELNGEKLPSRAPARVASTPSRGVVRARRLTGRALRKAARVVEPV